MRRCGSCGSKNIRQMRTRGPFLYKDSNVLLNKPIPILACKDCGEHQGPAGDGARIDAAVEETLNSQ